jgi:hypothetical protein
MWSYVVLLLLSIPGVIAAWKQRRDAGWMFLLVWFLLQPALLYAPTSAQRRLIVGWQIPLSILIAYGLTTYTPLFLARQFPRHGRRLWRAVVGSVVTLTTLTFGMLLLWNLASVANRQPEYFYSSDQLIVAHWLETHPICRRRIGVLPQHVSPAYADVRACGASVKRPGR